MGENSRREENPDRVTWEGCSVLLDINDGDRLVFSRLSPAATVKIGNKKLPLGPLVGCPFGSLFQVETGPKGPYLARVDPSPPSSTTAQDSNDVEKEDQSKDDCPKDNRGLVDNNTAQSLSSGDIEAMRREGATGNEIIEALIANSSTFEKKTVFSQEKYRTRKQKKYAPKVLLRRPFARSICEAYFKKHPIRIGNLRMDALSLLLSMANVNAYSDVLVVDKVGGVLTGAVAERLGKTGHVCNTYFGAAPYSLDIVKMFNFSGDVCCRIVQAPFSTLSSAQNEDGQTKVCVDLQPSEIQTGAEEAPMSSTGDLSDSLMCCSDEKDATQQVVSNGSECHSAQIIEAPPCSPNGMQGNISSSQSKVHKSVIPGRQASTEAIRCWKERGFTSLIVAAPELNTESIVPELLPLLSHSASFAIYHQYLQPLATCMHKLQASKEAIGLQISEPWLREYQVLPSRTHPHMQMSGFGGYILSGIRTCKN